MITTPGKETWRWDLILQVLGIPADHFTWSYTIVFVAGLWNCLSSLFLTFLELELISGLLLIFDSEER
eukprot:c48269_g1_i1 orf=130-333(+)